MVMELEIVLTPMMTVMEFLIPMMLSHLIQQNLLIQMVMELATIQILTMTVMAFLMSMMPSR